jgi:hypothetical protein
MLRIVKWTGLKPADIIAKAAQFCDFDHSLEEHL